MRGTFENDFVDSVLGSRRAAPNANGHSSDTWSPAPIQELPARPRTFPRADVHFARDAERALVDVFIAEPSLPDGTRGRAYEEMLLDRLERRLRARYPRCVVRAQDGLSVLSQTTPPTWYVFRDGAVLPADGLPHGATTR